MFDQDTFSKDDPLGEVQIPLWVLDTDQVTTFVFTKLEGILSQLTDAQSELHPHTGTKGKPVLRAQPPVKHTVSHVNNVGDGNNGRRSRSSSSSSSDDEKKGRKSRSVRCNLT